MLILTLLLTLAAQPFEHQDECIDPTMESMSWRVLTGSVSAIRPGGELDLINVTEWRERSFPRTVRLVDVDLAPAARPVLQRLIGKTVTVWINPRAIDHTHLAGVVYLGKEDLNRTMLARGLGRFAEPPAYSLSDYTRCLHRIAEREARSLRDAQ